MDTLLKKERIHVESKNDYVILRMGSMVVDIPFGVAGRVSQGIRLASKDAMRYSGEDVTNWRDLAALDDMPAFTIPFKVESKKQIKIPDGFDWAVGYEGENIKLKFGNVIIKLHFVLALKLSTWLRTAASKAKAWSGDGSRSRFAMGILSDAEHNYKLGIK